MSGTVNFNRTFSQSVALSDLTISDADTNLVVKNTSDSTPDDVTINIKFRDKFEFRRGRVNCSLNDNGVWRWF